MKVGEAVARWPVIRQLREGDPLGLGRAGSYGAHSSGEIIVGFSTANTMPRKAEGMTLRFKALPLQPLTSISCLEIRR